MPDLLRTAAEDAHRKAVEAAPAQVAAYLQDALGQKLVAYLAGVSDPKAVGRWASEDRNPRSDTEERLRAAFQIFQLLLTAEAPQTIRAWFMGLNPQLDDESPARAIREGRMQEAWVAAKAFLAGG